MANCRCGICRMVVYGVNRRVAGRMVCWGCWERYADGGWLHKLRVWFRLARVAKAGV